jgi:hypothetical protein
MNNLPETGKRQYENEARASAPRRESEAMCNVIFSPSEIGRAGCAAASGSGSDCFRCVDLE